jgi:RNA polymerase sigma-70 factor (ECF subfamily)
MDGHAPMIDSTTFADYLRRIRAGDEQAAADLVRQYEPFIRREVRLRLRDRRLRRVLDSLDVCQSVLASFFVRAAAGQYDLERPENLLQLLVAMTRNKVAFHSRQQHRQRRDPRRIAADSPQQLARAVSADPTPSQLVAGRDLLEEVRRRLTVEERRLADLRGEGRAWEDIATQLGGTAQARRMQLARALDRVAGQLGLDEESHA